MRTNRFSVAIAALLCASAMFPAGLASTVQDNANVKEIVERFVQAEFDGARDIRFDLVKFSPERKKFEEERDSQFRGFAKTWESDPLVVVASYRIFDIKVQGDRAFATVSYQRLIRTEGDLEKRKLVKDYKADDVVKLNLSYVKGKWWIFDPPAPRVSQKAIVAYYESQIHSMKSFVDDPKTSEEQRRFYNRLKNELVILENKKQK
jgi:hypothetical protein